jgi:hypothetical protein
VTRLTRRQLNRTLLRRQLLAGPARLPVADAVERVAGLQAQIPKDPYVGLWARIAGFTHDGLGTLLTERRLVRVALMRSTIHLVTAADCRALRPAVQPALDRDLFRNATWAKPVEGMDLALVLEEARAALREQPLTATELGKRLQQRWPDRDGRAMAYAVRNLEPLVQVPPRGLWGVPGQPRLAAARDWLGWSPEPGSDDPALARSRATAVMVERYLAAFGPGTVRDAQAWAGVTRLADAVESLRPRLRSYVSEDGRELWDLAEGELADGDERVPVRYLPEYDNAVLGYADRGRILPDGVTFSGYAGRLRGGSVMRGGILVDGFLTATWSVARDDGPGNGAAGERRHVLRVDAFRRLTEDELDDVEESGRELLAFVTGEEAGGSHVEIEVPRS